MPGQQDLIGYGQAQVLPKPASMLPFIEQLNQQKQQKIQNERYEKEKKDTDEYNRIKIIGDVLDPRNFNAIVHSDLRTATAELAKKINNKGGEKPSLAETLLMAQEYAGNIGYTSDQLNQLQQVLSKNREVDLKNPRFNANGIAEAALNNAVKDIRGGKYDPYKDYYGDIKNNNPALALGGRGGYVHDLKPDEMLKPFEGRYKKIRPGGGYDEFDWKVDGLAPAYFDIKDNGEEKEPTITTKSEPSGIKDTNGTELPMLESSAYERYKFDDANVAADNLIIQKIKGVAFDLRSGEAEKLRRILAYQNVDKYKPKISPKKIIKADPTRYINQTTINNGGKTGRTWDLTEYDTETDGGKNLTQPFSGFSITAIGNEKMLAKKVVYYPNTKKFKVTEYVSRDANGNFTGEKTSTWSAATMRQNIQGMNPGTDMKDFDALVGAATKTDTPKPSDVNTYSFNGKTYTPEQIAKAAKQSGLSVAEYVKKYGIK